MPYGSSPDWTSLPFRSRLFWRAAEEFSDAGAEVEAGEVVGGESGGVFCDFYIGVDGEVVKGLGLAGGGPGDGGLGDGGGCADADVLREGVGAEGAAGVDVSED